MDKKKIIYTIGGALIVILFIAILYLFVFSSNNEQIQKDSPQNNSNTINYPNSHNQSSNNTDISNNTDSLLSPEAEQINNDTQLSSKDKSLLLSSRAYLTDYGNYSFANQMPLIGLTGISTPSFAGSIEQFVSSIQVGDYSKLDYNFMSYKFKHLSSTQSIVQYTGTLNTNTINNKKVIIEMKMVYKDYDWLIDDIQYVEAE